MIVFVTGETSQEPALQSASGLPPTAGMSAVASFSVSPSLPVRVTVLSAVVPSLKAPFTTLNVTFALTFADVEIGESLVYVNSMNHMAVAINQGSFADAYHIGTRGSWRITMKPAGRGQQ